MSEEQLTDLALIVGVGSMGVGIVLLFLMVTLFFRKTEEVERRIATPGKQLDGIRRIWGNGPIGRWMRVVHVFFFFVFRNLPRVGHRIESRMGDEREALPRGLKLWVILPVSVFFVSIVVSVLAAWFLGVLD
ncbi:MAG: hypothetical protein KA296_15955 [Marinobacter sp.]|nr:hypothetical protein [Marinobacter sp.]